MCKVTTFSPHAEIYKSETGPRPHLLTKITCFLYVEQGFLSLLKHSFMCRSAPLRQSGQMPIGRRPRTFPFCECALAAPRVRARRPESAHSQARKCALKKPPVDTYMKKGRSTTKNGHTSGHCRHASEQREEPVPQRTVGSDLLIHKICCPIIDRDAENHVGLVYPCDRLSKVIKSDRFF